ncbi:MAG: S8/S53 family peptidase [Acidisphaera sp.]|nr:S8/S53 family peptidase [Acidisphaera sp.]
MTSKTYAEFAGSHREAPRNATRIADVADDEPIEVSVYLKPRGGAQQVADLAEGRRAALAAQRATTHADDIRKITDFATAAGLTVAAVDPARRLVKLEGPAGKMQAAFRTKLSHYHDGQRQFRARSGKLHLPDDVLPVVQAVLGLDTRPAAQPHFLAHINAAAASGHLPNKVGEFYEFPKGVTGKDQCIALIELGGGFRDGDTQKAFDAMGLAPPRVIAVSVDHGTNKPSPDDGADGEVALDIQVAGGVAPGALIAVYFAPNTDAGFADAISAAVHDSTHKPGVISISWGSAETTWTQQAIDAMDSALQDAATVGVSVFVASGDNLATDSVSDGRVHVDFPASSPWAVGCGGTNIAASDGQIDRETVWNDGTTGTGGGISDSFGVPDFQKNTTLPNGVSSGKPGRGVPDVAGDAAPGTGYRVVVGGKMTVVGGTSAVAPLWAGLAALINERAARRIGFFLPTLYATPGLTREVTIGDNKPEGTALGYDAGRGWNACTGLGVPIGQALFDALVKPVPAS